MHSTIFTFLFSPYKLVDFFKEVWLKKKLHISRNNSDYFDEILNTNDLDYFLQNTPLRYPNVRFVNNNSQVNSENYMNIWDRNKGANSIDNHKVLSRLYKGDTMVINSMERNFPKLHHFCFKVEKELLFRTQCNIYITPPARSQGFDIHYDTHDVIVLQISGTKKWNFYEQSAKFPTKSWNERQHFEKQESNNPKIASQELTMFPGDALYIPSGLEHKAVSENDFSVHITLGLFPQLSIDLFDILKKQAEEKIFFRKPIPNINTQLNEKEEYKEILKNELRSLIDNLEIDELLEKAELNYIKNESRIPMQGRFNDLLKLSSLNINTVVKKRDDIVFKTESKGFFFYIHMAHKSFEFPILLKASLLPLLGEKPFAVSEIQNISDELKLQHVKNLIQDGFLELKS